MSIKQVHELRKSYIERHGASPTELKLGRNMLDSIADEIPQAMFRPGSPPMGPAEWRDHIADTARKGELYMFGIRVELCE